MSDATWHENIYHGPLLGPSYKHTFKKKNINYNWKFKIQIKINSGFFKIILHEKIKTLNLFPKNYTTGLNDPS